MASGMVRAAMWSILTDSDISDSELCRKGKQQITECFQATNNNHQVCSFDAFADNLMKTLERHFYTCLSTEHSSRSISVLREKLLSTFTLLELMNYLRFVVTFVKSKNIQFKPTYIPIC